MPDPSEILEKFYGEDKLFSKGQKYDAQKRRWSLLPWKPLGEVADVMTLGAIKYSEDNWKHVKNKRDRYFSAAMRHLVAWKTGEKVDKETGKNALSHCICCLLFLLWSDMKQPPRKKK